MHFTLYKRLLSTFKRISYSLKCRIVVIDGEICAVVKNIITYFPFLSIAKSAPWFSLFLGEPARRAFIFLLRGFAQSLQAFVRIVPFKLDMDCFLPHYLNYFIH
jgi:hypothetical protein